MNTRAGIRAARVLIADDHPLVRSGLARLLNQQADVICCGEAGTVAETLVATERCSPDLLLLDLRLKSGDGLELIKSIRANHSRLRILVMSQHDEHIFVERALRSGARGYVLKDQAANDILEAIRTVLAGDIYLSPRLEARALLGLMGRNAEAVQNRLELLSDRELHVLQLLGDGMSTREIAVELHLSFKTVESHRENMKHKLKMRGAAELVHYAANSFGLP